MVFTFNFTQLLPYTRTQALPPYLCNIGIPTIAFMTMQTLQHNPGP